jgi:hypothetical protein
MFMQGGKDFLYAPFVGMYQVSGLVHHVDGVV